MFLAKTVFPELLGATINIDVGDSNLIKFSCCHQSTILLGVFIWTEWKCMLQDILCFQVLKEKNKVSFIFYLQSKLYCHKCIFEKEHDE